MCLTTPPSSAERKGPPYIIIKDGAQHSQEAGAFLQEQHKGQRKCSRVQARVLDQSFKIEKRTLLLFFSFSQFAAVQPLILENLHCQIESLVPSRR